MAYETVATVVKPPQRMWYDPRYGTHRPYL